MTEKEAKMQEHDKDAGYLNSDFFVQNADIGNDKEILQRLQESVNKNIELYNTTKEQLGRITVIYELTKAIISVGDFDELLKKISREAAKLFNATGCMIRLNESGNLKVKASYGFPDEIRDNVTVCVGEGLAGRVAEEGRTIVVRNPEEFGTISPSLKIHTAICTPLKIGDQIIGTFGLYDKKIIDRNGAEAIASFNEDDVMTLEGLASITAIVIDKSVLYENALRQEKEAIEAKNQVEELKDYLQALIENSADAIVTTDLNGNVRSWNMGAEKIYGYKREEVVGKYLPFVPDFLREVEKGYIERTIRGETIKDIETLRKTNDGRLIDVNLTISPIKDSAGKVIGTSGIARDITEKKRIEKDLIKRNSELSRIFFTSSAMRGTLELDKLLRMVLTAVTMGDGLGFNRAMLFLLDEERSVLKGAMGVGPSDHEEAWEIWSKLSMEHKSLHSIMEEIEGGPLRKDSFMDRLCCGVEISLDTDTIITRTVKDKSAFNVTDVRAEPLSDAVLIQQLGTNAYAVVPLVSRDKVLGVLWVDNLYSRRPITDHDMDVLKGFTDQIASAVENAKLFERVTLAEQELKNIFDSISDLLYVTDRDFTVRKVNKSVLAMSGKSEDEIIGKKSFEVFLGMFNKCEDRYHLKSISTKKPFIEELEDTSLGKTYLVSCSPIFDKSGELSGTVHIVRDISEIKKLREAVSSAERMAALGVMAAKVAHEIRNPLLSIGGFARRLEKKLDSDMKEYAKIIVDEVKRLEGILNDTLSFVKSGRMEKKETNLNEVIDNVLNLLEPAVHERDNVLVKEIEHPLKLSVDPDRIKEAVLNILTNSNQATDTGQITVRAYKKITLSDTNLLGYRSERKEVIIEVQDDGCGIRDDDMSRIFDPFFTTRPTGTGLGLSITKNIIEEHSGRIEVRSVWGEGTTFRIHLPLKEE